MGVGLLIRRWRYARGMGFDELVRRAGISRAALSKLESGRTSRPRAQTLQRIAKTLGVAPELLLGSVSPTAIGGEVTRSQLGDFDRQTNPLVEQVAAEQPALFHGWREADWEELRSEFGVGGPLTRQGVLARAERINFKRELVRKFHIVLETELADALAGIVDLFYRLSAAPFTESFPSTAPATQRPEPAETARPASPRRRPAAKQPGTS